MLTGAVAAAGVIVLVQTGFDRLEADFQTDARIAHRLLSQSAAQHDAVLAMLALLQPTGDRDGPARRLPAIYPHILRVVRREPAGAWPADAVARGVDAAQEESRRLRHPVATGKDLGVGRIWLALSAEPASYAIELDLKGMVAPTEWPGSLQGETDVQLLLGPDEFHWNDRRPADRTGGAAPASAPPSALRRFAFNKHLASDSQPFELVVGRSVGWAELPWAGMLLWISLAMAGGGLSYSYFRQRQARVRAEELLRLGQTSRLGALGELTAGLAHELNQPLTAVMANTQAAGRLLDEGPAGLAVAREAMRQAARQARRASDVLNRLRRLIERPGSADAVQAVRLRGIVDRAIDLLQPEVRARGIRLHVSGGRTLVVMGDPVGLEQIIHNLVTNSMNALEQVPKANRSIALALQPDDDPRFVTLQVLDTGPGLPSDVLPHVFEPFFTTRAGGLGLGLSLCESLAQAMGGRLAAGNRAAGGAVFTLWLLRRA
ncbi:MAG: ATP-binding protein [Lautropia sp.]